MNRKHLIKFLTLTLSIIFILSLIGCNEADGIDSNNTVQKQLVSQNKKYIAIGFVRDLGATTDFSTQVFLAENKKDIRYSTGNVFIANHSKNIDLEWKDNNTLIIYYDCDEKDIIQKVNKLDDISILYQKS